MPRPTKRQQRGHHMNKVLHLNKKHKKEMEVVQGQEEDAAYNAEDEQEDDNATISISSYKETQIQVDLDREELGLEDITLNEDLERALDVDLWSGSNSSSVEDSSEEDSGVDEADMELYELDLGIEDLDFERPIPTPAWAQSLPGLKGRHAPGTSATSVWRHGKLQAKHEAEVKKIKNISSFFKAAVPSSTSMSFSRSALQSVPGPLPTPSIEPRAPQLPDTAVTRTGLLSETFLQQAKEIQTLLRSKKLEKTGGEAWKGQNRKRHELVMRMLLYRAQVEDTTRTQASLAVANSYGKGVYLARQIRRWENAWLANKQIPIGSRGKYIRLTNWIEDEELLNYVRKKITTTGERLNSRLLCNFVREFLQSRSTTAALEIELASLEQRMDCSQDDMEDSSGDDSRTHSANKRTYARNSVTERQIRRWLHKLGYSWKDIRKGVYIDGHEREDVVEYRAKFVEQMQNIFDSGLLVRLDEETGEVIMPKPENIPNGRKPIMLFTHDESTFNANDGIRSAWLLKGHQILRPKARGKGIMVSDVITQIGRLVVPDHITEADMIKAGLNPGRRDAAEMLEYGKDNWWDSEKMCKHILEVVEPMAKLVYPDCELVFLFDNATNHSCFAPDALNVTEMNLNPGGKQPMMRLLSGFPLPPRKCNLCLQLRRHQDDDTISGCCARGILRLQEDFKRQQGILQETLTTGPDGQGGRGHTVIFYPKFHCELNWIEYYWGAAKRYTRDNCEYSIEGLRSNVPLALLSISSSLIHKFFMRVIRMISAYSKKYRYGSEEYEEIVYKSHRRVSNSRTIQLGIEQVSKQEVGV
ncbi:hypothetical protein BJ508DRAFT_363381 [Ascobolus immersus RN42]|uniref:Uncharacterized protein n=1 Tax=Ascobolus immersus RN42 TaxID=1160509 RepID=A0A3N4I4U2_ASCIM|nr:hypothetical protein BJ508DRAFT_363381 [Ascobolus immersus RN42]